MVGHHDKGDVESQIGSDSVSRRLAEFNTMNVAVDEVVLFLRDLLRKNKTNNVVLMYLNAKFGLQWR